MDQIPLPFAINRATTYEDHIPKEKQKDHKVWVVNLDAGLEKHQCSLQLAFSPVDDKLRISIIFRGTGKRVSDDEKKAYHENVDIYWQEKAWADTNVCVDWAKNTLAPAKHGNGDFILFCDNLEGQVALRFQEEVRKSGGIVWYGVKNATDIWQPVDAGMGRILKTLVAQEQQDWLEYNNNIDLWMGNTEKKLNVKERRILLTHWVGNAYEKFKDSNYTNLRCRCFQHAGCLITADGSENNFITPEWLDRVWSCHLYPHDQPRY